MVICKPCLQHIHNKLFLNKGASRNWLFSWSKFCKKKKSVWLSNFVWFWLFWPRFVRSIMLRKEKVEVLAPDPVQVNNYVGQQFVSLDYFMYACAPLFQNVFWVRIFASFPEWRKLAKIAQIIDFLRMRNCWKPLPSACHLNLSLFLQKQLSCNNSANVERVVARIPIRKATDFAYS